MKRLIVTFLVVAAAVAAPYSAKAIEGPFPKGTLIYGLQAGLYPGIGGSLYGDCVIVDSWWKGHFTVGAQLGFRHWSHSGDMGWVYNDLAVVPRATYGLNITRNFEVHAGALLGLGVRFYDKESHLGLCYGGLTGLRYFLSEGFALSAEFNYSGFGPWLNAGVALKF